ncbi:MAG: polyphosphate kinase 1 [Cryomorphaceae bacterium]|jgi:polyphosphate kinase|nr:polyphosphate kinase 1 [Cryomorphaceae bacterium]
MMDLINRELSWLSFNERVLQEAQDKRVPLIERVRFLGIYSNNLDEFFRVRIANLRRMIAVRKRSVDGFKGTPSELYAEIRKKVLKQQEIFESTYESLFNELADHGIIRLDENSVTDLQRAELKDFFELTLKHAIVPVLIEGKVGHLKLQDSGIYLAVKLLPKRGKKCKYALIQVPPEFSRFYLMREGRKDYLILLDDVIRLHLESIFSIFEFTRIEAFTFKFTRDAELDLDDDISISFIEKMEKSLKQRKQGKPVRFVYDERMPEDLLRHVLKALQLRTGVNQIPGGKYHNFKDFMKFPSFDRKNLLFPPQPALPHPDFTENKSLIESILFKDVLLNFPYQRFDYIVDLLREAAIDPLVVSIKINIYRVARNSQVMNALNAAVANGKKVTVVLELQARFDEEQNLYWADKLKENGARVIYGVQDLKVHSKLMLIHRKQKALNQYISYVGTGNFNERSAQVYSDLALLTSDINLAGEVQKVFRLLENNLERPIFKQLIVSPLNTRRKITQLIDQEIKNAKKGIYAEIRIKLNNLTDVKMIEKLYEAGAAGVKIRMIIRGICGLVPGDKKISENIEVISIVDRYLEHSRILIFENGGNPLYYITSADWMERNLDKRMEVACPIKSNELKDELNKLFEIQWKGNVKSRLIRKKMDNPYRVAESTEKIFHAQVETYRYFQRKCLISHK